MSDVTTNRPVTPTSRRVRRAGVLHLLMLVAALVATCSGPEPPSPTGVPPTPGSVPAESGDPGSAPTATPALPPQDLPPGWVPAPEPDDGNPPFLVPPPDDFTWLPGAELIPLAPVVTPEATESSTSGGMPGAALRPLALD